MWSSVKGPPKRGVGEEIIPGHATRWAQFSTQRDLIPTEKKVNKFSTLMMRTHGRTERKG